MFSIQCDSLYLLLLDMELKAALKRVQTAANLELGFGVESCDNCGSNGNT